MPRGFCHLHTHSVFSFLDSTLRIEDIVGRARASGATAVALTDANGLYGAVPFYKACKEAGIKPLLGAEIDDPRTGERAVVLARNFAGYSAISAMATRRHLGADWETQNAARLEALSLEAVAAEEKRAAEDEKAFAGLNPLGAAHSLNGLAPADVEFDLLAELRRASAEEVVVLTDVARLLEGLAGRAHLYAELILTPPRRRACRELFGVARKLGVPLAAACDTHFATPEEYETYKILRAIHYGTTVDRVGQPIVGQPCPSTPLGNGVRGWLPVSRLASKTDNEAVAGSAGVLARNDILSLRCAALRARTPALPGDRQSAPPGRTYSILTPHHDFKSEDEMRATFKSLGEAIDATATIAEACNVELPLGQWKIPRPPLPAGETSFSFLWKVAFEGVKRRYRPLDRQAMDRLRYEMDVIDRLGFSDYFLTVHAIACEARRRGFPLLGRGSAANSIVSYALGFTGVDPIRHNLYFERFLNPERGVPPDIDLDFSWKDRDAVLDWTYEAFGRDRVAMISTTITLQGRQAIREVGKALGLAESEVNRFTRPMPGYFLRHDAMDDLPSAYPECKGLPVDQEPWKTVLGHARRILDFPRHLSIHCGGILICPEPIVRFTPLQRAAKGLVVTQMDMHPIEELGLIKIDLLANRSLGVLTECLRGARGEAGEEEEWGLEKAG
ncbi:MAG: PHP domain-containing protein [Candidatus Sumerlaeota bacterium]|nr:PHP domain-containing protein [Candidatus Sumerlaeota bacterium]